MCMLINHFEGRPFAHLLNGVRVPSGQQTATTLGRSKIASRHEEQGVGATVGDATGTVNQELLLQNKYLATEFMGSSLRLSYYAAPVQSIMR
jgi:hypothetical protein